VQIDDVTLALLCDRRVREVVRGRGDDPAVLLESYATVLNRIARGAPGGLTLGLHMCRGNSHGMWIAEGGYDYIGETVLAGVEVDVFFMEYDSARSGDFQPLARVPAPTRVVLGLVSTKSGTLEEAEAIRRRIEEAAAFVPLSRLSLSPQCGFASSCVGYALDIEAQRRKLALVVDTARAVWGDAP
jgi:5-methyltetrahydropteroyltriglutamate--homocysteine methyltransferase